MSKIDKSGREAAKIGQECSHSSMLRESFIDIKMGVLIGNA
jgi:hypothetical protein